MTQETEFKEYDIVVGDGCYWVVVETVDGLGRTGISNLPDYRCDSLVNTWVLPLQPKMLRKSSMQEYFDYISGRNTTAVADNEGIYKLDFRCGKAGKVTGIFVASRKDVALLLSERIEVDFGAALGEISDVHGAINEGEIQLVTTDFATVRLFKMKRLDSGYNPFEQPVRNFDFEKNRILEEDDMTVEDLIDMMMKRNIADAFAKRLDGREYGSELTEAENKEATDSGLLVIYGSSDDLFEFRGYIYDEVPAYDNRPIYFSSDGMHIDVDIEEIEEKQRGEFNKITPVFGKNGITWTYETDIPHSTFKIMEDGEVYCIGMVIHFFNLKD